MRAQLCEQHWPIANEDAPASSALRIDDHRQAAAALSFGRPPRTDDSAIATVKAACDTVTQKVIRIRGA